MGIYDDTIKSLVGKNPQALISFVWNGAIYDGDVERELKARTVHADALYYVRWQDKRVILHIEFQVGKGLKMPRRIWEYNALADIVTGLPVYSVVVYLVERSTIPESVYYRYLPDDQQIHSFSFQQIKLWEIPPDAFEQPGLENLLPLLPLTKDGQNYNTVERMIRDLRAAGKQELLWLGEALTALVLTSDKDKQWIKERFHSMLHEILQESWVYQETREEAMREGRQEGRREGRQEGLQEGRREGMVNFVEGIVRLVELRFPALRVQAKEKLLAHQTTLEQLQITQDKLYLANTLEEAAAALQEHGTNL